VLVEANSIGSATHPGGKVDPGEAPGRGVGGGGMPPVGVPPVPPKPGGGSPTVNVPKAPLDTGGVSSPVNPCSASPGEAQTLEVSPKSRLHV